MSPENREPGKVYVIGRSTYGWPSLAEYLGDDEFLRADGETMVIPRGSQLEEATVGDFDRAMAKLGYDLEDVGKAKVAYESFKRRAEESATVLDSTTDEDAYARLDNKVKSLRKSRDAALYEHKKRADLHQEESARITKWFEDFIGKSIHKNNLYVLAETPEIEIGKYLGEVTSTPAGMFYVFINSRLRYVRYKLDDVIRQANLEDLRKLRQVSNGAEAVKVRLESKIQDYENKLANLQNSLDSCENDILCRNTVNQWIGEQVA